MKNNWKKGDILYNFKKNENIIFCFVTFLHYNDDWMYNKPTFEGQRMDKEIHNPHYSDTYIKIGNIWKLLNV